MTTLCQIQDLLLMRIRTDSDFRYFMLLCHQNGLINFDMAKILRKFELSIDDNNRHNTIKLFFRYIQGQPNIVYTLTNIIYIEMNNIESCGHLRYKGDHKYF